MDPSQVTIPPLKDLTIDNITPNVHLINSHCPDPRLRYILDRAVTHLHDFARETRLSHTEWQTGIDFLTAVGHKCTDVRQEFILLSDILGLSLLVDSIDHPKPRDATEGTVLGPFHSHEAEEKSNGEGIAGDPEGEECFVCCEVVDREGRGVQGVKVDVWETDSKGFYDVQYPGEARDGPDQRAVLRSDGQGRFWFKAIVPVPYPIPSDGPVGQLLIALRRHCFRPSHMHFMFEKEGYDHLITSLFLKGDPYETSDAVFGVKDTLVVELGRVGKEMAEEFGVKEGVKLMQYRFVLVSEEEARKLREKNALEAMEALGRRMKLYKGLPVPDLD